MMLNVLYITNSFCLPGGLERVLSVKTSYFAETFNWDITIISLDDSRNQLFYQFSPKVKLERLSRRSGRFKNAYDYLIGIKRIIGSMKPDIIVVCDDALKGFLLPVYIKLFLGYKVKVIYERHVSTKIHNISQNKFGNKICKKMMNFCSSYFDEFVVLTESHRNEWPKAKVSIIPNMLPFFPKKGACLSSNKIIAVGKISEQKAYGRMLDIWKEVSKIVPDWELHIYGAESDGGDLRRKCKNLGLDNSCYIHPPCDSIQQKYTESSIMLMTSIYEGLPMVLLEAMACGLPCIAYDCPYGPRDIIENDYNGYLIKDGDKINFISRLIHLMKNRESRLVMGENARHTVNDYAPNTVGIQWKCLFNK